MQIKIETGDWRSSTSFWRVPIYMLEDDNYILEAEIVLGVLYRKDRPPNRGDFLQGCLEVILTSRQSCIFVAVLFQTPPRTHCEMSLQ